MPETMSRRSTSPFTPLRHRDFRRIWAGNFVSGLGTMIQGVGAAWLMTEITDSVDLVALVQTAMTLPVVMFALIGGAIADSFDRRLVMLVAQVFMLVTSAILAAITFAGAIDAWTLLAFTFLVAAGAAVVNPTWHASVGDLVPREEIPAAVGLHSVGFNLSRSIGPAVGGAIVAAAGAAMAFLVNALSFIAIIVALLMWKRDRRNAGARELREPLIGAMTTGIRYVFMSPPLLRVLARNFLFGTTAVSILALLPSVAERMLGGDALTYGLLLGAYGAGAVAAAVASSIVRQYLKPETIIRIAFLAFALCALLNASGMIWATAFGLLLGGGSWVFGQTLFNTSMQLSAPRWVVGRAISFFHTASFGGMAFGSWIWGVVAEQCGLQTALVAASIALALGAAVGLLMPMPVASTEDLGTADDWQAPATAIDITPRSGPVSIEITYRIPEENRQEFLRLMVERRHIRRRDGAQNWTLMRDIHDPERWIERYRTPRWVDYIRHNRRRTKADAKVHQQLLALHGGPGAPTVNRYLERPAIVDTPVRETHQHPRGE